MALDLFDVSNDDFEDWLRDAGHFSPGRELSEERLVELVSATLREVRPEFRARSFVDLANLCFAMADKALGSQTSPGKCLEVIVSVGRRH